MGDNRIRTGTAIAAIAVMTLGFAGAAQATVSFTLGNHPETGEENILFGSTQTGTTITGSTNKSDTGVKFTSTQNMTTGGIGQAFIEASSGLLTNFDFSVPNHTFQDFIINPMIGGQPTGGGGTAFVTAHSNDGDFHFNYDLGNGNNFLTIVASAGETISSVDVSLSNGGGFNQLKQPRVSSIGGITPVPEPASILLLGTGLLAIGFIGRRRSRKQPDAAHG